MRLKRFNPLLIFLLIISASRAVAQTCSGSLGDPVINQTFGSGSNPGTALSGGITNMSYTSDKCAEDGYYTIANSLVSNCYNTWPNVTSGHTGNPNGYMTIVNASFQPSMFF